MSFPVQFRGTATAVISALVLLGACSSDSNASTTTVASSVPVSTLLPSENAVDADLPDEYLQTVLTDVATRTGLAQEDFTLLDSTAVEWADQRLGCVHFPEPSDPRPIDGYRVVVDTGEAQYDFRLDDTGTSYLCGDPIDSSKPETDEGDHHEDEEEKQ